MKLLVRVVGGLLVLAALALGLVWIFQDRVVKAAVEGGGSWATGVETRVDDVSAALLGGELALDGLRVANPPGFSAEPFFALRKARADWETGSLWSDTIHVREFALEGLALRIERNASGTNYGRILDHASSRKGGAGAPSESSSKRRTLVVERIVLRDLTAELVLADVPLVNGPLRVTVPRLEIQDFRSDGETHALVGQLLAAIVEAALDASLESGKDIFPKDLARDLESRLAGAKAELEKALGGSIHDAVEKAADDAQKALEGIGGILGGKKP